MVIDGYRFRSNIYFMGMCFNGSDAKTYNIIIIYIYIYIIID